MQVRCNWCMKEFDSDIMVVRNEREYCPFCNATGCVMNLEEIVEENGDENEKQEN